MSGGRRSFGYGGFRFDSYGGPKSESRMRAIKLEDEEQFPPLIASYPSWNLNNESVFVNTLCFIRSYKEKLNTEIIIDKRILPSELKDYDKIKHKKFKPNIYAAKKRHTKLKTNDKQTIENLSIIEDNTIKDLIIKNEIDEQVENNEAKIIDNTLDKYIENVDDNDDEQSLLNLSENNELEEEEVENDYNYNYYDEIELGDYIMDDNDYNQDDGNTMNF